MTKPDNFPVYLCTENINTFVSSSTTTMGLLDFIFGDSDEWDMTKNYLGKHGEFDLNDEERIIEEEIYGMKAQDHDADVESHFGWEHVLSYDCDDYPAEEDW